VTDAMRHRFAVQSPWWRLFGRVSDKGSSEDRQQPVGFQTAQALGRFHHACRRPAERHGGISPSLHIATDGRTVPIMFSIELVQASDRRSFAGSFMRLTVSISFETFEDAGCYSRKSHPPEFARLREKIWLSRLFRRGEQLLVATRSSFSKGALQNDICRFESSMPSQPVRSLLWDFRVCENRRHCRGLGWRAGVSSR
jgi:hypothetical protein